MVPKYKININYVFLCLFIMYSSLLWGLGCVCLFYHNQSINCFHLCRTLLLATMVLGFCEQCLVWGIFLLFQVVCFVLFCFVSNFDFSCILIFCFGQAIIVLLYICNMFVFMHANMEI